MSVWDSLKNIQGMSWTAIVQRYAASLPQQTIDYGTIRDQFVTAILTEGKIDRTHFSQLVNLHSCLLQGEPSSDQLKLAKKVYQTALDCLCASKESYYSDRVKEESKNLLNDTKTNLQKLIFRLLPEVYEAEDAHLEDELLSFLLFANSSVDEIDLDKIQTAMRVVKTAEPVLKENRVINFAYRMNIYLAISKIATQDDKEAVLRLVTPFLEEYAANINVGACLPALFDALGDIASQQKKTSYLTEIEEFFRTVEPYLCKFRLQPQASEQFIQALLAIPQDERKSILKQTDRFIKEYTSRMVYVAGSRQDTPEIGPFITAVHKISEKKRKEVLGEALRFLLEHTKKTGLPIGEFITALSQMEEGKRKVLLEKSAQLFSVKELKEDTILKLICALSEMSDDEMEMALQQAIDSKGKTLPMGFNPIQE